MKSFFDLRENKQITEAVKVSRKDFDKLKKGSMITIDYGSSVNRSNKRTFMVKGKSRSAKYNVDKVNMVDPQKPGGMKFHLYSRDGGDATLALGDMGATINSYSIKEAALKTSDYPKGTSMSAQKFKNSQKKMSKQRALSTKDYPKGTSMSATAWKNRQEEVELDEAIDFRKAFMDIQSYAKKNGGMDKTDFEKVAYYVKAIGDNQNTPNVANKAFMLMKKHIAGLDTDVRDGIHMLLKKHGMIKNGRIVQESIELDEGWRSGGGGHRSPFKAYSTGGSAQSTPSRRRDAKYKELSHEYETDKKLARKQKKEEVELEENKLKDGDKVKTPQGTVEIKTRDTSAMRGKQDKFTMILHMKNGKKASMGSHPAPTASAVTSIAKKFDKGVPSYMAHLNKESVELDEKAVSKSQQKFFGMVRATQKGEMDDASPEVKKAADSMSKKDVKDFAKTKHKDLPDKVKEDVDEATILRTKTTRKQSDASKEKDRKKAVKTFQNIRKGKYSGVKMANEDDDPCWDSHKMVGMKKKGDKMVPNCVPK